MNDWRDQLPLPPHAALNAVLGGIVGALVAFIVVPADIDSRVTEWWLHTALTTLGAAAGTTWWAVRQARMLRGAIDVATSAMSGRSIPASMRPGANEAIAVVAAVNALVDRAEHTTRDLSQRQAYAAVGDFASELARELAPSVATARSAIRTLEGHLHLDSPFRAPLDRAQRELHRLSNTLQDTLRLARSGKLASRRLDLWLPLRAAMRTASTDATARRVWMEPPVHGRAPIWIHGDQDALEQLFLNLLINGVQATDAGGRVEVQVGQGEDATVTITDTGCGIPDGALDRVFEPFYTTKPERAGLGLAIAWRTAAAHGGRLSIESSLGRGTSVQVALPLAEAGGSHALSS